MSVIRPFFAFVLLCAFAMGQTPPPSYSPPDCSQVSVGSSIKVTNNSTDEWIFIQMMLDGVAIGDPVLIPPGGTCPFPVPNSPGSTYRLDPTSPSTSFDGL